MNSKGNKILIGIIVFLIGVFFLTQKITFNFTSFIYIVTGLTFVLLYITKRKSWSLVIGVYLTWFGLIDFINKFLEYKNAFNLGFSTFFISTAIIFFVLYYQRNKRELLLPASILLWWGIYIILKGLSFFSAYDLGGLIFVVCFSLAFYTTYFLGGKAKGFLFIGTVLMILGAIVLLGKFSFVLISIKTLIGIILIFISIRIIYKELRK